MKRKIATPMKTITIKTIKWLIDAEEHNYPAAESYLKLIYTPIVVRDKISELRKACVSQFKAKDIFRASGLSLLGVSNSHVERDIKKIKKGHSISPILLVRDAPNGKVIIADGYHRLCAIYTFEEDAQIACKII